MRAMFARLCAKAPVIASSAIDSATCAVASAARKRVTPLAVVCLAPYACKRLPGLGPYQAPDGKEPDGQRRGHRDADRDERRGTLKLTSKAPPPGIPGTRLGPRRVNNATGRLNKAAGSASTSDSASSSEARRPRDAPIDARTAISPVRAVARTSMSPATLAQHRSSTKPLNANSSRGQCAPRKRIGCWFARAPGLEHEGSRAKRFALLLVDVEQQRRFDFAQDRADTAD